jgi:hypothetical protein
MSAKSAEELPAAEIREAIPTLPPEELLESIFNQKKSAEPEKKSASVALKLLPRPNNWLNNSALTEGSATNSAENITFRPYAVKRYKFEMKRASKNFERSFSE